MNELISTTEKSSLERLLALSTVPEMTFSYSEMQGYLFGIAITPEKIAPEEWFPVMFGEEGVAYESKEQQRRLLTTLFNVLNKHIAAFQADSLFLPFDMANLREGELEKVLQWASGFEEALALCPHCWEESPDLTEEEHEELLNSLLVVEGIVYPEDAADIFEYVPYEELAKMGVDPADEQISKTIQIQYLMLQAFDLAVDAIVSHAAVQDEKRKREKNGATTPFEIHAGKAGKNVGCPCGSGRKFKDCCGASSPETMTQHQNGWRKNVIKVDFTQRD